MSYWLHHVYHIKLFLFRFQAGEQEDCWIRVEHSTLPVVLLSVFSQVRKPEDVKYSITIIHFTNVEMYNFVVLYNISYHQLEIFLHWLMSLKWVVWWTKENGCVLCLKIGPQTVRDCFLKVNNFIYLHWKKQTKSWKLLK
jgi:hypothetical protein